MARGSQPLLPLRFKSCSGEVQGCTPMVRAPRAWPSRFTRAHAAQLQDSANLPSWWRAGGIRWCTCGHSSQSQTLGAVDYTGSSDIHSWAALHGGGRMQRRPEAFEACAWVAGCRRHNAMHITGDRMMAVKSTSVNVTLGQWLPGWGGVG